MAWGAARARPVKPSRHEPPNLPGRASDVLNVGGIQTFRDPDEDTGAYHSGGYNSQISWSHGWYGFHSASDKVYSAPPTWGQPKNSIF
jgi:hypothetical protein